MAGAASQMPAARRVGNRFFALLVSLLGNRWITDSASGMRVFRREIMDINPPCDVYTHVAGIDLIAEKIEDDVAAAKVVEAGVDFGQGYLLGEPRPAATEPLSSAPMAAVCRIDTQSLAMFQPTTPLTQTSAVNKAT